MMYLDYISKQTYGPPKTISHLTTPLVDEENAEEINEILREHDCIIQHHPDHNEITFPPGTQRWRGVKIAVSERYYIHLPDGYIIHESYDMIRGLSFLSFPREVKS